MKPVKRSYVVESPIKELDGHKVPLHRFSEFHPAVSKLFEKTWHVVDPGSDLSDLLRKTEFIKDEAGGWRGTGLNGTGWYTDPFGYKIFRRKATKKVSGVESKKFQKLIPADIVAVFHEIFHNIVLKESPRFTGEAMKQRIERFKGLSEKMVNQIYGEEPKNKKASSKGRHASDFHILFQGLLLGKVNEEDQEALRDFFDCMEKNEHFKEVGEGAAIYGTQLLLKIIGDPVLIKADEHLIQKRKEMQERKEGDWTSLQQHVAGYEHFKKIMERECPMGEVRREEEKVEKYKERAHKLMDLIRSLKSNEELRRLAEQAKG